MQLSLSVMRLVESLRSVVDANPILFFIVMILALPAITAIVMRRAASKATSLDDLFGVI